MLSFLFDTSDLAVYSAKVYLFFNGQLSRPCSSFGGLYHCKWTNGPTSPKFQNC